MHRITRVLAATTAAATVVALTACSSGEESEPAGAASTSEVMTVTSSAPVPGPVDSSIDIPALVADRWNQLGGEGGELGLVTGPATDVDGGSITVFDRGAIVLTPAGRAFVVQGEILTAYQEAGGPAGELGFPTADEATTDGGWISTFEHGVITYFDGVAQVQTN